MGLDSNKMKSFSEAWDNYSVNYVVEYKKNMVMILEMHSMQ